MKLIRKNYYTEKRRKKHLVKYSISTGPKKQFLALETIMKPFTQYILKYTVQLGKADAYIND